MSASIAVRCPHCSARLRAPETARGGEIRCPKCAQRFAAIEDSQGEQAPAKSADASTQAQAKPKAKKSGQPIPCPSCNGELPAGSVFCTHCGYNLKTKRKLAFVPASKPKRRSREPAPETASFPSLSWAEILLTPCDVEYVLTESIVLTMWMFLWLGLLLVYIGCIAMLQPMMVFAVSAVIAGILRVWIISKDVSILLLIQCAAGMSLFSFVIALGIDRMLPAPEGEISRVGLYWLLCILFLIFLLLVLRMISFFFGKYFALCRRAALRATFSDEDRGGLIDLGYALVLLIVGFGPFLAVEIAFVIHQVTSEGGSQGSLWAFVAVLAVAFLWFYVYTPMGVAVVALKGSCYPQDVFQWSRRCMPDYLWLLLMLLPFHMAVWALSTGAGMLLSQLAMFGAMPGILVTVVWSGIIGVLLDQYVIAVTVVALGSVLRRNEPRIAWHRFARNL